MLADAAASPKPGKQLSNQPVSNQLVSNLQALTYSDGSASLAADDAPRALEVGGEAVALTEMGPIVINADGSLARISNWSEMSEREREVTKKRITKRNAERLALLRSEQPQSPPPDGSEGSSASGKVLNALPEASDE